MRAPRVSPLLLARVQEKDQLCLSRICIVIFDLLGQSSWLDIDHELRLSPHTLRDRIGLAFRTSAYKIRRVEGIELMKDAIHHFSS